MIHGQKRTKKEKAPQQLKQQQQKSQKINAKLKQFFQIRQKQIEDYQIPALLQFTSLLMQLCSDIPTVFNFRREVLNKLLNNDSQNVQERGKILTQDYKLNTKIIQSDPKSYTLWTHRQWIIMKIFEIDQSILLKEKQLCKKLLQKDQKNFHVWNYRSWVNSVKPDIDYELKFTKEKITQNPFNFSPLHFRSKYLQTKYNQQIVQKSQLTNEIMFYGLPKALFDEQLESIQTAIFLNPKQEAPWTYFNWMIQRLVPAILINKKKIDDKTSELTFNMKISNPKILIKSANAQTLKVNSVDSGVLSDKWLVESESDYQVLSNMQCKLGQNQQAIKLQNNGFFVIGTNKRSKQLQQLQQLLNQQLKFVGQVIQSQQNQICRFGLLQCIQIRKALLWMSYFNNQRWEKMCQETIQLFDKLKDETKSEKYIAKLREYWKNVKEQKDQLANLMKIYQNRKVL